MAFQVLGILFILLSINISSSAFAGTYLVSPDLSTKEINAKLNSLKAGDTLVFLNGVYQGPFKLNHVNGAFEKPVVIRGEIKDGHNTIIDGRSPAGIELKNYAFRFVNCSHLEIRNFKIQNCWTDAILAIETSYLSIDNCIINGGKRALFAKGRKSHHFLIENCYWEQDKRVWDHSDGYTWEELHHGIYKYLNGSIFQGDKISGVFVIRDNTIKNTFNAFRLSLISGGKVDSLAGTNGEIYRNTIINTADNVLEPELFCHNLYFYHNRMINGHAWISFTEVGGGFVYIYGNTGISLPDSKDGWTIFKISKKTRSITKPFYVFNNSYYVDFDIVGSNRDIWDNDEFIHFNNAYYIENKDSFGIYNTGHNNIFDYDCSNLAFPEWFIEEGYEKNGIVENPDFNDPLQGDFTLKNTSPCINNGMINPELIPFYNGDSPDMGAYEGENMIFGKPFTYMKEAVSVDFIEHPRICRYRIDGSFITFWFTVPVSFESIESCNFKLITDNSNENLVWNKKLSGDYFAVFSLENPPTTKDFQLVLSKPLIGKNGAKLTSWASEVPVIIKNSTNGDN